MQSVRVAPPFHHATGELVDDDDLVVLDDVIGIGGEQLVRAQPRKPTPRAVSSLFRIDTFSPPEKCHYHDISLIAPWGSFVSLADQRGLTSAVALKNPPYPPYVAR